MEERTQVLAAHRRARGGWHKAGRNTARSIVALTSAAVFGTMGYGWWAVGDVDAGTVTTNVISQDVQNQRVPLDGAIDLLLVGIDSRTDAYGHPLSDKVLAMLNAGVSDGVQNTDTMILVHIPVDGTRAVAISFPRDSWVELAGGFGHHRLNSAFSYAYNNAREELQNKVASEKELDSRATVIGRKNLIATIQRLIGHAVTIDRYAEVNLASFYEVTKAIGGVEVCLKKATHDPLSGANFRKGTQTISGAKALAFVRQRHGLEHGDLDRIRRQQAFLGALANKVLSADMLTSPTKVRDLIRAVQRSVVLSSGWELSKFAGQMSGLSSNGIDFYTAPVVGEENIGGADVLQVDPQQVAAYVKSLTSDEKPTSSSAQPPTTTTGTSAPSKPKSPTTTGAADRPSLGLVTVDVRNGSTSHGIAGTARDLLVRTGFNAGDVGDAPVQTRSEIHYAPGERNLAKYAAGELGGAFSLVEDANQPSGRLLIVLGTSYQGPTSGLSGGRLVQLQPSSSSPTSPPAPELNANGVNCVY